jgi:hypothetical protein
LRIGVEIREKRRWWNFGEVWWMLREFQKQREFAHFQGDHCHCWCFQRETNAWDIPCRWWWWVGISRHRRQMLFLFNSYYQTIPIFGYLPVNKHIESYRYGTSTMYRCCFHMCPLKVWLRRHFPATCSYVSCHG